MEKIRTFIGVPLTERIQEKIARIQADLKDKMEKGVSWVSPQCMHITVKFLGNIDSSQIPEIQRIMQKHVSLYSPWNIKIQGMGVFPHLRNPKVIWIGVENALPLVELAGRLDDSLSALKIPSEGKKYHCHITLGRIKQKPPKNLSELVQKGKNDCVGEMEVTSLILFKSLLQPKGSIYIPLVTVNLETKFIQQS